jgi:hypothetical protein
MMVTVYPRGKRSEIWLDFILFKKVIFDLLQIRFWATANFFRESPFSGVGVGENLMLDKDSKNG